MGTNLGNVGKTDAPFDAQRGGVDAPPQDITESDFGPLDRVSTRQPTGRNATEDASDGSLISNTEATLRNEGVRDNLRMITENYPGMRNLWSEDVAETAANITTQMRDNIVSLYDLSDELGISTESAKWYDGARRIAGELSDRFRVPRPKTSAVLAVLSPQKDWYQNVALGERLIKHHTELTPDVRWSSAMDEVATTPKGSSKEGSTAWTKRSDFEESVRGRPWGEMETPTQKAMWLRAYDEAHYGSRFREISPEGDVLGYITKKDGTPASLVHQGFDNIEKAVRILEGDGSAASISDELGEKHKVRNFFNNIWNPDSPYDVTGDTHQIAAGTLRPLGGSTTEVSHGLATSPPRDGPKWSGRGEKDTGQQGSYGLYFDATSEAAKMRDVLPRQMQSVSWEQLRTLFPDTLKRDRGFISSVESIWRMVDDKEIAPDRARELIIELADTRGAGGVPSWKNYTGPRKSILGAAGLLGSAGVATAEEGDENPDTGNFARGGLALSESHKGIKTQAGMDMADNKKQLDRKKADIDGDGELSDYEKQRGEAIQNAENGLRRYHDGPNDAGRGPSVRQSNPSGFYCRECP
jgi:hypothetical protein